MPISQDIKDRVFAAADRLYAESKDGEFPNVDAVRQESRVGMNAVVEGMKEWRQQKRTQVLVVREPLPAALQTELVGLGQSLWEVAQRLANESLDLARAAFEAEKADLLQLSSEQSEAFESQSAALASAKEQIAALETGRADDEETIAKLTQELHVSRAAHTSALQHVDAANSKVAEIENRVNDLRAELAHAHADAAQLRAERDAGIARADAMQAELTDTKNAGTMAERLHAEKASHMQAEIDRLAKLARSADAERDQARQVAATAREEAASLRGEADTLRQQNAAILATLAPVPAKQEKKPAASKK